MIYNLTIVLIFIVSILLVLIILIQVKGGGIAENFIATTQIMGMRRTADFLEKATWTLGASIIALSIIASISIPRSTENTNTSIIEEKIMNMPGKTNIPVLPSPSQQEPQKNN
ncbi:MAG: preprotein translocase subunit SecG [Bacteroidales bacterium]|nr:preprotein translocase subunit SecG [Bacteroidales bacterium]